MRFFIVRFRTFVIWRVCVCVKKSVNDYIIIWRVWLCVYVCICIFCNVELLSLRIERESVGWVRKKERENVFYCENEMFPRKIKSFFSIGERSFFLWVWQSVIYQMEKKKFNKKNYSPNFSLGKQNTNSKFQFFW